MHISALNWRILWVLGGGSPGRPASAYVKSPHCFLQRKTMLKHWEGWARHSKGFASANTLSSSLFLPPKFAVLRHLHKFDPIETSGPGPLVYMMSQQQALHLWFTIVGSIHLLRINSVLWVCIYNRASNFYTWLSSLGDRRIALEVVVLRGTVTCSSIYAWEASKMRWWRI